MRSVVTVLCMGMIALVAAALVVIDMIIKLLPLLIWERRRRRPAAAPAAVWNVPDAAAFASAAKAAGMGTVAPGRRYPTAQSQDHPVIDVDVIDAEVISEDDHHVDRKST